MRERVGAHGAAPGRTLSGVAADGVGIRVRGRPPAGDQLSEIGAGAGRRAPRPGRPGRVSPGAGADFARDHLRRALQQHRVTGQWQALAQTYFLLGNVSVSEGDFHAARDHFEQAVKIIGDRRAPLLLGSIYTNLSNLILWREYGQAAEGIETIEKAIFYLKQAKNDRILAYAYSNLGYGLGHVGDWARAEQALHQAIELGRKSGDRAVQGTALDTLGEITMLRGDFEEAETLLNRAIENAHAASFPFGEEQALQTLGRCLLMRGDKGR